MEPVVVKATNLPAAEAAQRLPLAITPLPGERLDRAGILSAPDLARAVPNFFQHHGGQRSFADNYVIRGVGNTEFFSDPAVVLYVDDAPFGDVTSYTTDLLAIDHLEVHRGPQGSRFGRNAEAGVIRIVTRQPPPRMEAEASASVATFDTQRYQARAAGPLVKDTLSFSLAGQYAISDGYIRNTFLDSHADEREAINGRASLRWQIHERWDASFAATADRYDDGVGLVSLNGNPRHTMSEFDGQFEAFAHSQSLRVRGELPAVAITSVTTRRDYQLDPFKFDPDFSPIAGNTGTVYHAQVWWSEEWRVRPVAPTERWDWHAGFFFSTDEISSRRVADLFVPPVGPSGRDDLSYTQGTDTYALFGELTHTAWNQFDVTLGGRLDYTVRDLRRARTPAFGAPLPSRAYEDDYLNAAPKLTLAWHVTDTVQAYGGTGLGFKPGGFSPAIEPPASPKYDTETAWASELGLKSLWRDGKFTANVALFYDEVFDYQVEQFAPNPADLTVANAPRATLFGAELELAARPAAAWEFSGFFGYTHARLSGFTDPFTGTTVRDTRPPFVAEFNGGVAAQYQHRTGLFGRVEFAAVGPTHYDAANRAAFQQSAYGLLAARAGFDGKRLGVFFFAENLTDTGYYTKKVPPFNFGAPGRPRTFGVKLAARF